MLQEVTYYAKSFIIGTYHKAKNILGGESGSKVKSLTVSIVIALAITGIGRTQAADTSPWFWCAVHHSYDNKARNFYSNVFRGKVDHKNRYERAFEALIAARILKRTVDGEIICFFNNDKGETRRDQNEYALERKIKNGGSVEFIDWSY